MRIKGAFGLLFCGDRPCTVTLGNIFLFFTARTVDEECYFFIFVQLNSKSRNYECFH